MDFSKELEDLITTVIREGASDVHFSVGRHPTLRVQGSLIPLTKKGVLTPDIVEGLVFAMLSKEQKEEFLAKKEFDLSFEHKGRARFRVNVFYQRGFIGCAMRLVPVKIRTVEELNLPTQIKDFTRKEQGFFLVVGPTGQGKTTTLAALIDMINHERAEHIVTIEDPIEYLFTADRSIIDQREVRSDTTDFHVGLRSVFRQDINVLMVGEMRDHETMAAAVTAAETGHLVFSTLHTNNAAQTIDRIIDSFPGGQQDQIRSQISSTLLGIFSQRLIPRVSGGLIPAYELLIANAAVNNLIREKRIHEINLVIDTSSGEGMISLNRSLMELLQKGEITMESAVGYSLNPQEFRLMAR
ncbi:MAG: PilT/PilU family type 4a pilus ATPase [bacterium]|nr:PilT/PilU family type 4a pilus ATPase [bacterium]